MAFKQDPPFAVQVELSEGCNLYCDFCGLQGIREQKVKDFKFMTPEVAKKLAISIKKAEGWNPRIEFAMHGEPTMNPQAAEIVAIFRKRLPKTQLMMTSNGGGLLGGDGIVANLRKLFDAGLNVYAFDAYEYVKIKDKVDAALSMDKDASAPFEHFGQGQFGFEVHRYPDEKDYSPHSRYPTKSRLFIRVQDISVTKTGTHSVLNNHCGAGSPPLKQPMQARCAKPFRELSVRWDGSVAICCNDWRGVFKVGNAADEGVDAVWNARSLRSARRFLMKGDRASVSPCNVCDAKSYRVGLLPDKKGKVTMRDPNKKDRAIVDAAVKGSSYTEAVIRPWEIKKRKR